jgi:hypothetical protein
MHESRDEIITFWMEDITGQPWFMVTVETEHRILQAFRRVLTAIPEEDFHRFMEATPQLLCVEGVHAATMPGMFAAMPAAESRVYPVVIYLSESLATWSDDDMVEIVAHESAHVVLGHYDPRRRAGRDASTTHEAEADHLSQTWGFRPREVTSC